MNEFESKIYQVIGPLKPYREHDHRPDLKVGFTIDTEKSEQKLKEIIGLLDDQFLLAVQRLKKLRVLLETGTPRDELVRADNELDLARIFESLELNRPSLE